MPRTLILVAALVVFTAAPAHALDPPAYVIGHWHAAAKDLSELAPQWPRKPGRVSLWIKADGDAILGLTAAGSTREAQFGKMTLVRGVRLLTVKNLVERESVFGMHSHDMNRLSLVGPGGDHVTLQRVAAPFDSLDLDGDGFLTLDELKNHRIEVQFVEFDMNRDQRIDPREFQLFWAKYPPGSLQK